MKIIPYEERLEEVMVSLRSVTVPGSSENAMRALASGMIDQDVGHDALRLIRAFVAKHEITCEETIFQTDRVIEDAYSFIANLVMLVGFHKDPEGDE